jgi:hypothetical protein
MTLRPEFALGHSEYNGFLFAVVDEEELGLPLTVLSALTRLGIDPWQEAARLTDLPRELAAQALAEVIAKLPGKTFKAAGPAAIAARLVRWLPIRSAPTATPAGHTKPIETSRMSEEKSKPRLAAALLWGGLAVAAMFFMLYGQDDNNLEPGGRSDTQTEQPLR